MLLDDEKVFYNRQLLLTEIGEAGQLKLKESRVLVIGAGGLGCPVLTYLTAAGVGTIGIVDSDIVDKTNLHRQVLFGYSNIDQPKVEAAISRLKDQNPAIIFKGYFEKIVAKNALSIIKDYDIVIDASDNFPTRYLINDACIILDKPFVLGSIDRFQGQLTVLNFKDKKGEPGPTYRCLFPFPPKPQSAPNCSQIGVIGVLPGIIGSMQANEVIKMIVGFGDVLSSKLFMLDSKSSASYTVQISRNEKMAQFAKNLEDNLEAFDYVDFCHFNEGQVKEIMPTELKEKLAKKANLQIIDINEKGLIKPMDGSLIIPLSKIKNNIDLLNPAQEIVLVCDHGISSISAAKILMAAGFENISSLKGGLEAWNKGLVKEEAHV